MYTFQSLARKCAHLLTLFFILSLSVLVYIAHSQRVFDGKPGSRIVMERAMQIVRDDRPSAPQASLFYAQVAKRYYEEGGSENSYSNEWLYKVLAEVMVANREFTELPIGEEYWESPRNPVTPHIHEYDRFILDNSFSYIVPPPPLYGSDEYQRALHRVKTATINRTPSQETLIAYWAGVTGTETPAGIWQNKLWDIAKNDSLTDTQYAWAQMILAEGIADAFMECWDVKYTYWTKRPSMVDPSIKLSFPNPNFPSYVSGHATISYTASTLLARMFPQHIESTFLDAEIAKNTRLWSGVHFAHDNEEGMQLGIAVGDFIINKLSLEAVY